MSNPPFELVPDHVSDSDLRDEVLKRSAQAGYSTRLGECPSGTKIQALCGFGKTKLNIWPRDKHGNLIED